MYVVAKEFKTVNRKFQVDDVVAPSDVEEGSAMTFADLKERGFVKAKRVDYGSMTRQDLEALAAERVVDISAAKSKADVVAALEYAEKAADAVATGNLEALHKADLERMAAERGMDTSQAKTKAEFIALLEANPAPVESKPGV